VGRACPAGISARACAQKHIGLVKADILMKKFAVNAEDRQQDNCNTQLFRI
jgi:hypothetical protein